MDTDSSAKCPHQARRAWATEKYYGATHHQREVGTGYFDEVTG